MMKTELTIGETPILPLKIDGFTIWGKAEFMNPSGSVKDRPIYNILKKGFEDGLLKKGDTVVEATSGNAGISFAMFCVQMGLKCVIVMPSNMSEERKKMLKFYGAELIEVGPGDFDSAIKLRDKLSREQGWFNGNQFDNPRNLEAHYNGTGVELMFQCKCHDIKPTAFISGTGTGGTLMGAGRLLKEQFINIDIVAVEPSESPVMSGGEPGLHGIQGIGDGSKFMVDLDFVDKIITVSTQEATEMALRLAKEFGIFVGISAGANVLGSLRYCQETNNDNVITILCDRGERYLSCM
jgi:cysteine synthase A